MRPDDPPSGNDKVQQSGETTAPRVLRKRYLNYSIGLAKWKYCLRLVLTFVSRQRAAQRLLRRGQMAQPARACSRRIGGEGSSGSVFVVVNIDQLCTLELRRSGGRSGTRPTGTSRAGAGPAAIRGQATGRILLLACRGAEERRRGGARRSGPAHDAADQLRADRALGRR